MTQLPLPKPETPTLLPAEQRKLRTFYQMHKRGQATAIRVQHDDVELIGYQYLVDCGYAEPVREGQDYTVFDVTEAGLRMGSALSYAATIGRKDNG